MATPPRVVVADPDPNYQSTIAALLHPYFHCRPASSLRQAWLLLYEEVRAAYESERRLPLLILELNQPDGSGLDLIRYLQADPSLPPQVQLPPIFQKVLIACLSQRSSLREKLELFRAGADDFIVKPFPLEDFAGRMLLLHNHGYVARIDRTGNGPSSGPRMDAVFRH